MAQKLLQRYKDNERMNHWFMAMMFFLAGLSGLAFFHPSLFFLTNLFGGGQWARILHPFLGVVMALTRRDSAYLFVFAWSFVGIAVKQVAVPMVAYTAWAAALVALGLAVYSIIARRRASV